MDIEVLKRLMEPEDEEVSLRYILKYSTRSGSNMFQLLGTAQKKHHFVASKRRWLERQGKKVAVEESWQNEWHDIKYQGVMAKASSVPREDLVGRCGRQAKVSLLRRRPRIY